MASIKYSGIGITEMAGKVGGSVMQRNKSGAFLRKSTKPSQNRKPKQVKVQRQLGYISSLWRTLTVEAQKAWNAAAASGEWDGPNRLGDNRQLSGFQLFQELNLNLLTAGVSIISLPAVKQASPAVQITGIIYQGPEVKLEILIDGDYNDYVLNFEATASLGIGIQSPAFYLLFLVNGPLSSYQNALAYEAVFGSPLVGGFVWFKTTAIHTKTGQRFLIDIRRAQVV